MGDPYAPFKVVDGTYRVWCQCCSALHYLTTTQAEGTSPFDCRLQDQSTVGTSATSAVDQYLDALGFVTTDLKCGWVKKRSTHYDPYS